MASSTPQAVDLTKVPAAPPPPGVTPNLVDPPDMWPILLATIILALTFTGITVSIRLFTKLRLLRKLAYEDYVLILAEISLIVWCVLLVVQPTHGADIWNTSVASLVGFAYWSNLLIVLYVPGVLLAKWAILLQLQRVFTVQPRDATWWTVRVLIWVSSIFYVTVGFFDIFQCTPREKIWNPSVPGRCFNIDAILIVTSVFNVLMNCSILILPLMVLRSVQMQRRKRILVSFIFGVTAFAAVSSIMRTVYSVLFMHTTNPTRVIFPVALWAVAEISCVIIATTFPTMPRFFEYVRAGFDPRTGHQSGSPTNSKKNQPSSGKGRKSWFQLTTVGGDVDEEKQMEQVETQHNQHSQQRQKSAGESEVELTRIDAAYHGSRPSTAPPSRSERSIASGITKTVEVEVASIV